MIARILFVVGFCLLVGQAHAASKSPDLILVTEEWPPYNYIQDGQVRGFSTDIVRAIMAELGEEHEIRLYPGPRATAVLNAEPYVMGFSYFRTAAREDKYKWIGPLVRDTIYFYKNKRDSRRYKGLADVRVVDSIVVSYGGLVAAQLDALGFENHIGIVKNRDQIRHVLRGRADLLANFTRLGLSYYLRSMGEAPDALVPTGVKVLDFTLNIACSKTIPDAVIARWQAALDKVHATGTYDRIYAKYLNRP